MLRIGIERSEDVGGVAHEGPRSDRYVVSIASPAPPTSTACIHRYNEATILTVLSFFEAGHRPERPPTWPWASQRVWVIGIWWTGVRTGRYDGSARDDRKVTLWNA